MFQRDLPHQIVYSSNILKKLPHFTTSYHIVDKFYP
jgi:hypothetical protein